MTDPCLNIAARKLIQRLDESLDGVKLKYAQKAFRRVNGEVIEDSCSAVWFLVHRTALYERGCYAEPLSQRLSKH